MPLSSRSPAERFGLIAAFLLFLLLAIRFQFVCDDAYISFRYARHLAEGAGLRFNLGESPPVEGYSNLLWVLWLAPFHALGASLPTVAIATSAACGALLFVRATRLAARELELDPRASVASALFLASSPPFAAWTTGGLETMPFALAVFWTFDAAIARGGARAAMLAATAATLLRPDGMIWVGVVAVAAAFGARAETRASTLRVGAAALAAALAASLAQAGFRWLYHGDWVANTTRVKAEPSIERALRGARYVASLMLELPLLLLAPLCAALLWRGQRWARAILIVIAASSALAIAVGGDFMAFGRFLVPAMPFFMLAFAASLRWLSTRRRATVSIGAATLLALASNLASAFGRAPVPQSWRQAVHFRWNEPAAKSEARQWSGMAERAREWLAVGRALAACAQPGESIVLAAIGATAYPNELVVHDTFGLVDREVASRAPIVERASPGHDKRVDPSFFVDRRPTYFGAWLAPTDAPLDQGLPPGFQRTPIGQISRVERCALPDGGGFAPGVELRLLRGVYAP